MNYMQECNLILPPKMAAIFAVHGYDVHCTNGRFIDGSRAADESLKAELHQEFRSDMKGIARRMLDATDISCDNIAAVCGLSAHTVRGMSTGTKNYKGKIERTEMSYEEILQQVEW